ncbi:MAG: hypothetical protein HYT61_00280 [Candidatus Yanofskybacteria bacterium]|nr:hypothetical protein [Candidatus Yanofskybacteria bacterium]
MTILANFLTAIGFIGGIFFICIPTLGIAHNWDYLSRPEHKSDLKGFLIMWLISGLLTGTSFTFFWIWPELSKLTGNGFDWVPYFLFPLMLFPIVFVLIMTLRGKIKWEKGTGYYVE